MIKLFFNINIRPISRIGRHSTFIKSVFLSIFVLVFANMQAQNPGGVATDLQLWLKADAGATSNGANELTAWTDQSTIGRSVSILGAPTHQENGINFNPVVNYDGQSTNRIDWADVADAQTVFALLANDPGVNDVRHFLYKHDTSTFETFHGGPGVYFHTTSGAAEVRNGDWFFDGTSGPATSARRTEPTIVTARVISSSSGVLVNSVGGQDCCGGRVWSGDYPELIIYNRRLSDFEIQQVETYLGIKYGRAVEHDYLCLL